MTATKEWMTEALVIGTTWSRCGACGKGAFPDDKRHETQAGYGSAGKDGCGVTWRYVTTDYAGDSVEKAVREMRPDLEWRPMFPDMRAA